MILYKVSVGRINSEQVNTILVNYTEFLGCTRLEGRKSFQSCSNFSLKVSISICKLRATEFLKNTTCDSITHG